jgi:hypothetical protein
MRLKRWQLQAVDREDGIRGLAAKFNDDPETFFFRRSARQAAWFFESRVYIPCHFYVVPVDDRRTFGCLPWAHDWTVTKVTAPLWDPSAKGILKRCKTCGKTVAQ